MKSSGLGDVFDSFKRFVFLWRVRGTRVRSVTVLQTILPKCKICYNSLQWITANVNCSTSLLVKFKRLTCTLSETPCRIPLQPTNRPWSQYRCSTKVWANKQKMCQWKEQNKIGKWTSQSITKRHHFRNFNSHKVLYGEQASLVLPVCLPYRTF